MTMLTITMPKSQWILLRDYADAGLSDKTDWLQQVNPTDVDDMAAEHAELEAASCALIALIYALKTDEVAA
jgi:ACT domain-containing protein